MIGAFAGLFTLYFSWQKRKGALLALKPNLVPSADITYRQMFKELFSYAAPYVFVGLAIPLYQYIDTNTFNKAMIAAGYQNISQDLMAIVTLYVPKLVMIPVSLATAFGLTLIPAVTENFTNKDFPALNKQIDQAMQIILFIVLPASVGMALCRGRFTRSFTARKACSLKWDEIFCSGTRLWRCYSRSSPSTLQFCRGEQAEICGCQLDDRDCDQNRA